MHVANSLVEASCSGIEVGLEEMRHGLELVSVSLAGKLTFQALKGLESHFPMRWSSQTGKKVILVLLVSEDANRP